VQLAEISYLKIAIALCFLFYVTILDLKYREVEPKIWLIFGIISALFTGIELSIYGLSFEKILYLTASVTIALTVGGLAYFFNLFGGADFFALLVLAILHPWYPTKPAFMLKISMPFILVVLINSLIASIIMPFLNLLRNIRYLKVLYEAKMPFRYKLAFLLLGYPISIHKYLSTKFVFPLILYEKTSEGKLRVRYRFSFSIDEEHYEHQMKLRRLVNEGLIDKNTLIWVTQGIPLLVFLTFGYVFSLIVGDIILCYVFTYILKISAC